MISCKEVVSNLPNDFAWLGCDTSRLRQIIDTQYNTTIIGGREVSKALKKSSFLKTKTKNAYDL